MMIKFIENITEDNFIVITYSTVYKNFLCWCEKDKQACSLQEAAAKDYEITYDSGDRFLITTANSKVMRKREFFQ
jgi:hypothetical protein